MNKLCLTVIIFSCLSAGCATSQKMSGLDTLDKASKSADKKDIAKMSDLHNEDWYDDAANQGRGIKKADEEIKSFDDFLSSDTARSIERNLGY